MTAPPVPDGVDSLLTESQAAEVARVSRTTVRAWVNRGYLDRSGVRRNLQPAGLTDRGHKLYRMIDVAKAEAATRARAGRIHW
ncbi:hypothetical protein ACFQNE_01995 [Gordonia phosphorivorans]|uniref:HTH merR-type domain-containing protein n=1 Tax=Gordonia phosphorivorans TaxID=1056982 RepID=A0ABV6H6K3_9ACTN